MRRLAVILVVAGALMGGRADAAVAPAPTAVGIGMREFSLTVYRASVKPGPVRFNITNRGEDAHNLQVAGPSGYRSAISPDMKGAGGRATLDVRLRTRGTYRLLCVKPGHTALGMRATLRVR